MVTAEEETVAQKTEEEEIQIIPSSQESGHALVGGIAVPEMVPADSGDTGGVVIDQHGGRGSDEDEEVTVEEETVAQKPGEDTHQAKQKPDEAVANAIRLAGKTVHEGPNVDVVERIDEAMEKKMDAGEMNPEEDIAEDASVNEVTVAEKTVDEETEAEYPKEDSVNKAEDDKAEAKKLKEAAANNAIEKEMEDYPIVDTVDTVGGGGHAPVKGVKTEKDRIQITPSYQESGHALSCPTTIMGSIAVPGAS